MIRPFIIDQRYNKSHLHPSRPLHLVSLGMSQQRHVCTHLDGSSPFYVGHAPRPSQPHHHTHIRIYTSSFLFLCFSCNHSHNILINLAHLLCSAEMASSPLHYATWWVVTIISALVPARARGIGFIHCLTISLFLPFPLLPFPPVIPLMYGSRGCFISLGGEVGLHREYSPLPYTILFPTYKRESSLRHPPSPMHTCIFLFFSNSVAPHLHLFL